MKTIIVGCGRMGSGLARKLESQGVDVTIIDTNPDAFEALGSDFKGKRIVGIGFDQDILTEAKIKMVDSVVACTNNDETNALIARIAQNIYRVPKVVARLYDAHKAEIYHSLGVQTISTTSWGIARAFEILNYCELDTLLLIGDGQVEIVRLEASSLLHGRTVNDVSILGEVRIVTGDILYVSVLATSKNHLQSLFGLETK
jgi:trk system potassium uptake protein TrkA